MEESEQGKVTGDKIRVKRTSDTTAPYRCLGFMGFTQREMWHFQQRVLDLKASVWLLN